MLIRVSDVKKKQEKLISRPDFKQVCSVENPLVDDLEKLNPIFSQQTHIEKQIIDQFNEPKRPGFRQSILDVEQDWNFESPTKRPGFHQSIMDIESDWNFESSLKRPGFKLSIPDVESDWNFELSVKRPGFKLSIPDVESNWNFESSLKHNPFFSQQTHIEKQIIDQFNEPQRPVFKLSILDVEQDWNFESSLKRPSFRQSILDVEEKLAKDYLINQSRLDELEKSNESKSIVLTTIICPSFNNEREKTAIIKNSEFFDLTKLIKIDQGSFLNTSGLILLENDNLRGLIRLDEIFKAGFEVGNTILYFNSDCVLSSRYLEKINKINDINFLIRNNDNEELYKIGVDGFCLTKEFYDAVLVGHDWSFYIGEPYWDVCLFNLCKKYVTPNIDIFNLSHVRHIQKWDTENLSAEGQHNKKLYDKFVIEEKIEPSIEFKEPDLSIIITIYGKNLQRENGLKTCLSNLMIQYMHTEIVVVEVNMEKTNLSDYPNNSYFKHIFIESTQTELWQKEALMNIGVKKSVGKYLMFLDSDVFCENPNWLKSIVDTLEKEDVYLQPFKTCFGTAFNKINFHSKAYAHLNPIKTDSKFLSNPGLCVAIRRESLERNGEINPLYPYGCGDSGMFFEMTTIYDETFFREKLKKLYRPRLKRLPPKYLNYQLWHIDHGIYDLNYYKESLSAWTKLDYSDVQTTDKSGLLTIKEQDKAFLKVGRSKYKSKKIYLELDGDNEIRDKAARLIINHFEDYDIVFKNTIGLKEDIRKLDQSIKNFKLTDYNIIKMEDIRQYSPFL